MRWTLSLVPLLLAIASPVQAEIGFAVHVEGAAARMVGPRKVDQFGWGGSGLISPELTFSDRIGLEVALGAVGLSDGAIDEPGLAPTAGGYGLFALPGLRLRPFGRPPAGDMWSLGGLWLSGGAGLAYTGDLLRPALDARVGYDVFSGHAWRGGPSVGFLQILETRDTARPEDARVLLFGLHGAFEPARTLPASVAPTDDTCRGPSCPDADRDGDGIPNLDDACPDQPEDHDGFQDDDGCPDPDNDGDGIPDVDDACPDQPEDRDGFQDDDGCPDPDNDGDGIPDVDDACPDEPETFNDYADDDGCPDAVAVRVVGDEILLDERVHFAVNHAEVLPRSWPLLARLATLLVENPAYTRVRIQGHADDTGDARYNQQLSERRARAVRDLLVAGGVDPDRLVTEGFGQTRPREDAPTPGARSANRRVEFLIIERREVTTYGGAP